MAMLDSFFTKGFKAAKCKTLLKLTIPRIKLLRNRREIQVKQMRREIAKLLETGQEATARIRVEHIIREEKMMAAQEIVELFCELITVRLPIIEAQRECPLDLKEAISSVCFAAPRCADLPELQEVQILFAGKYGKEFISAATELMPECGVNRQLIELLSIRAPAPDVKLKLLKEIAEQHEVDWDPSTSESELLKAHEDLLNGPTRTVNISQAPLPKEKHEETKPSTSKPSPAQVHSNPDEDFEIIDFPEVPKQQPSRSNKGTISAPEMLPFPPSALSDDDDDQEEQIPSENNKNLSHLEPENASREDKQFVPFIYSPSQSFNVNEQNSPPSVSKKQNDNVDLQDILAAAQMAAETAERAAIAARSAAGIAQLRINELVKKNNCDHENPFHLEKLEAGREEKGELDLRNSFGDSDSSPLTSSRQNDMAHQLTTHPSCHGDVSSDDSFRQPQRLPSMDDETYFSYPNLFTSERSDPGSRAQSFTGSK